jgi:NTP pyrophosphatase (non-canonical NTP hydrolase)
LWKKWGNLPKHREGDLEQQKLEFGVCLAWLVTIASMAGINMEEASSIYHNGCPKCKTIPADVRKKQT